MKKKHKALTKLDGIIFAQCIHAGCAWMMEREKQLDDINVFPVPDSDTGTNMSATMKMVKYNLETSNEPSISNVAESVAESALMESRGNSGAILSQFFQGFAESVHGQSAINTQDFAKALSNASYQAYQAVSDPKEGTILTVMREWSQYINDTISSAPFFSLLILRSLKYAEKVLQKTKTQMEVLKNADVVDAGAQGFVYMLEGIVNYIQQGYTQREFWKTISSEETQDVEIESSTRKLQYTMECLLLGNGLNHYLIREELESFCSSVVIAGSKQKAKIVLQTNEPALVVKKLRNHGEVQQEKIDDTFQQNRVIYNENLADIALVTDSACDLPDTWIQEHHIHKVPFRINIENESYLDELTIQDEDFYTILTKTGKLAKTSQPSQADFARTYDWTKKYFKKTISIHLSRALSACEQAARQTALRYTEGSIFVLDSKSASLGTGMLVLYAAKLIENNADWDLICKQLEKLTAKIKVYFMVKDVSYLIKGGRLSGKKGMMAKMLNIKPILYLDESGSIVPKDKAVGIRAANKKMFSYVSQSIKEGKKYWAGVAHTNNLSLAESYKNKINKILQPDEIMVCTLSPTLGAHTGPNAIGVAFMELDQEDIDLIA